MARGCGIPVTNYSNEVVTLWYRPPDVLLGNKDYMMTIDVWSIGCIFAEMVSGKALFTGLNDNDQIKKIFRIMGTPNENIYPGIKNLSDWNPDSFEIYTPQDIRQYVPGLETEGVALLLEMLHIDPEKRISVDDAINHDYFNDCRENINKLIYKC